MLGGAVAVGVVVAPLAVCVYKTGFVIVGLSRVVIAFLVIALRVVVSHCSRCLGDAGWCSAKSR